MDKEIFEALVEIMTTFFHQPKSERQQLRQAGTQLEPAAMPIVIRLMQRPDSSIGELAQWIGRDHSAISRQVDRLVRVGWVVEPQRGDRRIRRLRLTATGRSGLMQMMVMREIEFSQRLKDYTPQQRRDLLQALRLLAKTLQEPEEK